MDRNQTNNHPADLVFEAPNTLRCSGAWTNQGIVELQSRFSQLEIPKDQALTLQGSAISAMDSAGAWLLMKVQEQLGGKISVEGLNSEHQSLLALIQAQPTPTHPDIKTHFHLLSFLGQLTVNATSQLNDFLSFIGETFVYGGNWLFHPKRIRWIPFLNGIHITGYNAIPIVGLLSFLIGIVLAYQMGLQLTQYGANIFVVDLLGISVLREFAPLLTAIIVAGRTGSAYTAQLGTMKLNQEVDALLTMGLSPIEFLVLPKTLALVIALPLLTVLADVFGVFGGMVMSRNMLDISYTDFLQRFGSVIEIKHYYMGLVKTPVFALLIASIGCYEGFQVTNGAESVGTHTTSSVVKSIFMIIVADAGFSVLFSKMGI